MKIPESLKKVLSQKEIDDIKSEFQTQVELNVESALHQYDDEAIKKINLLVKQIDESHKTQLVNLFEKRKAKEKFLIESLKANYEKAITYEADKFKAKLATTIEKFIDSKIDKVVNYKTIKEAARNNTAMVVLEGLRKQLGVDFALMKESISTPMLEARDRMKGAFKYIKKLKAQNEKLSESLQNTSSNLLIENRVANLPQDAADHMRRMMTGRDPKFITEQFDYTLGLYKQGHTKNLKMLKEEALRKRDKAPNKISEPKHQRDLINKQVSNKYKNEEEQLIESIAQSMVPTDY